MKANFDVIVIAAGVIGLAIARELTMFGQQVLVLEAASRAGTETSACNLEVIHAGLYYPINSLKARYCVEGRQQLYTFCAAHGVTTRRVGKLIVATTGDEEAKLQAIHAQATSNDVHDLEWLTSTQGSSPEPAIFCNAALLSPTTGILDVPVYVLALQASAERFGTTLAFQTSFLNAEKQHGLFEVSTQRKDGETSSLKCRVPNNSAGHGAHNIETSIAGFDIDLLPQQFSAEGNYCSLSGQAPFNHLIYSFRFQEHSAFMQHLI